MPLNTSVSEFLLGSAKTSHSDSPLTSEQTRLLAGTLTCLIFLVACIVMALVKSEKGPHDYGVLQRCLQWAQYGSNVNYIGQRIAHRVILLATGACVLLSPWLCSAWQRISKTASSLSQCVIVVTLTLFFAAAACFWHDRSYCLVLGIALVLAGCAVNLKRLGWTPSRRDYSALLITLGALLFLPTLWLPLDCTAQAPENIVDYQSHYSTVVMQGDKIAAGQRIFSDVKPYYGVLLPLIIGVVERYVGQLSFGSYIQIIKYMQLTFVSPQSVISALS